MIEHSLCNNQLLFEREYRDAKDKNNYDVGMQNASTILEGNAW